MELVYLLALLFVIIYIVCQFIGFLIDVIPTHITSTIVIVILLASYVFYWWKYGEKEKTWRFRVVTGLLFFFLISTIALTILHDEYEDTRDRYMMASCRLEEKLVTKPYVNLLMPSDIKNRGGIIEKDKSGYLIWNFKKGMWANTVDTEREKVRQTGIYDLRLSGYGYYWNNDLLFNASDKTLYGIIIKVKTDTLGRTNDYWSSCSIFRQAMTEKHGQPYADESIGSTHVLAWAALSKVILLVSERCDEASLIVLDPYCMKESLDYQEKERIKMEKEKEQEMQKIQEAARNLREKEEREKKREEIESERRNRHNNL